MVYVKKLNKGNFFSQLDLDLVEELNLGKPIFEKDVSGLVLVKELNPSKTLCKNDMSNLVSVDKLESNQISFLAKVTIET